MFALYGAIPFVKGSVFDVVACEPNAKPQDCYDLITSWVQDA